jgi:phage baseplate assembly protein V
MDILDFKKIIAPLQRKIMLMIGRAVLTTIKDTGDYQKLQIELLNGDVLDNVTRLQNYGFTSVPKKGAEAILACVGGNHDNGFIIACGDKRYRLKGLKSGEVAIYTDEGDKIHLKRGNNIEITTNKLTVIGDLEISGKVDCTGNIESAGEIKGLEIKVGEIGLSNHKHISSQPGNPTSTPVP